MHVWCTYDAIVQYLMHRMHELAAAVCLAGPRPCPHIYRSTGSSSSHRCEFSRVDRRLLVVMDSVVHVRAVIHDMRTALLCIVSFKIGGPGDATQKLLTQASTQQATAVCACVCELCVGGFNAISMKHRLPWRTAWAPKHELYTNVHMTIKSVHHGYDRVHVERRNFHQNS